jgi:hypothetical protein
MVGRSRATNDPRFLPKQTPSRRAQDRRRKDLVAVLIEGCGGDVGELALVAIRKAAELTVAAEVARARLLNGDPGINIEILVKLEGEARRAMHGLAAFGLTAARTPGGPAPGLAAARARWADAERARKESTDDRSAE